MLRKFALVACAVLGLVIARSPHGAADDRAKLLAQVGLKPTATARGQMDTVGFASTAAQMDMVRAQAAAAAAPREAAIRAEHGWTDAEPRFVAAVCPHDDYYYASRLYQLALTRVRAPVVVLFGVFHKARAFDVSDRLVFDRFATWRGAYGPVRVSPLRADLLARIRLDDRVVDNDMHQVEHSLEALVPFLQANNPNVEIVPILVPHMEWPVMERLAGELGRALVESCRARGWTPGRDVAFVLSADAVHYGDVGWGATPYCPFGSDLEGYRQAVAQDRQILADHLTGPVRAERLKAFLYRCVEPGDVARYRITWCGRFSIPLGLQVADRVTRELGGRQLRGTLLDYGTSVSEASLDDADLRGLGTTAPNNLHHFVGYAAVGYYETDRQAD
ncbi:MAG TPA: AmmeMemoRadiSam system protein B [Acidobacteriota bacterium]|nr:AmmeMemoRadiSam system protein B [Acidobacteriota bacterium]